MKKLLSIIGAISLVGTSTTSLVACNTQQKYTPEELSKLKEENKIKTNNKEIRDNLEWIAPQEKPFNTIDNKYYYVVWKGKTQWYITKFLNKEKPVAGDYKVLKEEKDARLSIARFGLNYEADLFNYKKGIGQFNWKYDDETSFKSVYRWNLDSNMPDLILYKNGNVKVNGE